MKELNLCLELAKAIKEKNKSLVELKLKVASIKSPSFSDMPKGGGAYLNPHDEYLIKSERIQKQKERLQKRLNDRWSVVIAIFNKCDITDDETITLMRLRFYKGFSWNNCLTIMKQVFPDSKWNANKCFRVYRSVLCKIHKNNTEN